MEHNTQIAENMALYSRWVRMWNGELDLSDEIIGEGFIVHLASDAFPHQIEIRNARTVRAWIDAIRAGNEHLAYNPQREPSVSGSTVMAYWQATGKTEASGGPTGFAKVGVDVLRIADGKFVECWTANFSTTGLAA
jgi:hypothetical protein